MTHITNFTLWRIKANCLKYQLFDVQDRVAIELRTHLVDKIYSVERTSFQAAVRDKKNRTPLEGRLGHEDWRQERPNSKSKSSF